MWAEQSTRQGIFRTAQNIFLREDKKFSQKPVEPKVNDTKNNIIIHIHTHTYIYNLLITRKIQIQILFFYYFLWSLHCYLHLQLFYFYLMLCKNTVDIIQLFSFCSLYKPKYIFFTQSAVNCISLISTTVALLKCKYKRFASTVTDQCMDV